MTLLEVAASIAILTIVALGVALLVVPIARQTRVNRETATANLEARKLLEEIQATPFNDLTTSYPSGTTRLITGLTDGRLIVSYADSLADPLEVTLDLSWTSPDLGTMHRTFQTTRTE